MSIKIPDGLINGITLKTFITQQKYKNKQTGKQELV